MSPVPLKIGALAQAAATPVETIRYYERLGLLPEPARTEGNFRAYQPEHLARLQFIRHCRGLDMSLDEIRVLLRFKDAPGDSCAEVNQLLDAHIGHVSQRIRELRQLETQLKGLRQQCGQAQAASQCGILTELAHAAAEGGAPARPAGHLRAVHGVHEGSGSGAEAAGHTHGAPATER